MGFLSQTGSVDFGRTIVVLLAVAALAAYDLSRRIRHRPTHLLFACLLGTILSVGLINVASAFLEQNMDINPAAAALAVLLIVLGWKALFGPWDVQTKATMLGTFLFWIILTMLLRDDPEDRLVRVVAALVALVPAGVWCMLFLKYHRERASSVFLMFFAGMLSTVPILFYDALVRRGIELEFFLLRITPQSFNRASTTFFNGQIAEGGVRTALLASLLSFLIVGLIEETSKYWVLRKSGERVFTSIDDVVQLSIIVAIGFAFAENIVNPVYFTGFVREYLLHPTSRDIFGFLTNVLGRSVLTTMVHVVSTGVLGYFLGRAIFADPLLMEQHRRGRVHRMLHAIRALLRLPEAKVFRTEMITTGLVSAILLHGAFNFLVTLPDLLPAHPRTIAELLGLGASSPFHVIPILLLPSLFYVVGGFWLLTELVMRRENSEEHGHPLVQQVFVERVPEEA